MSFAILANLHWGVHLHSWKCNSMKCNARCSRCTYIASLYALPWPRKCWLSCKFSFRLTSSFHASVISCADTASLMASSGTWYKAIFWICSWLNTFILMFTFDRAQGRTLWFVVEKTLLEGSRCAVACVTDHRLRLLMPLFGTRSLTAELSFYLFLIIIFEYRRWVQLELK